jgi:cbb3-type cytochrome oxidase cytochrome c subunit
VRGGSAVGGSASALAQADSSIAVVPVAGNVEMLTCLRNILVKVKDPTTWMRPSLAGPDVYVRQDIYMCALKQHCPLVGPPRAGVFQVMLVPMC